MEPDECVIRFVGMIAQHIKKYLLVPLLLIGMVGCNPTPAAPATSSVSLPIETITPLSQPTTAPPPTATQQRVTPTVTPEPGLRTQGPYFTYFRQVNDSYQLVMMDADGGGRKVIDMPDDVSGDLLSAKPDIHSVSPDGRWLAYYTGSARSNSKFDLTLCILNLETGEKLVITPLLSKDYPNNFVEAVQQLNTPDVASPEGLQEAFVYGVTKAIGWSPNGRYLAFAGQMDGLSSDLYVYDMYAKTIQRLTSGPEEMQWIDWSPDGQWILHGALYYVGEGMTFDVFAASFDGLSIHKLSTSSLMGDSVDWLNAHQYFEYDGANGPGSFGLRLVDINTGKITKIWDGSFSSYAVDKSGTWAAVQANTPTWPYQGNDPNFSPGPYLINLVTLQKSRIAVPDTTHHYVDIKTFGQAGREFVMMDQSQTSLNPAFLSKDGKLTQTDLGNAEVSISPNLQYWIAVTSQEVKVYSQDNLLVKDIPLSIQDGNITDLAWRLDSSGLFVFSYPKIYYVNITDSTIKLVESNFTSTFDSKFMWTSGQ